MGALTVNGGAKVCHARVLYSRLPKAAALSGKDNKIICENSEKFGMFCLQAHHERILKKFLPKLKKHLDKNGIDTGIYTLKWFFQCFLDRV